MDDLDFTISFRNALDSHHASWERSESCELGPGTADPDGEFIANQSVSARAGSATGISNEFKFRYGRLGPLARPVGRARGPIRFIS
jgi:hypothetical protein